MPSAPRSLTARSQRWRERRDFFVPNASEIVATDYTVAAIDCIRTAAPFVVQHHYSGSFVASRLSVGLFRNSGGTGPRLVGVATFSVPMNNSVIPKHAAVSSREGVELGRFVLLDDVPGNGETFFASRAFRILRSEKPEVIAVVSYADPVERRSNDGHVVKPGHLGSALSLVNAQYRGRAAGRTQLILPNGAVFSERAASKVRNGETGCAYAVDQLTAGGCPSPDSSDLRSWLEGLIRSGVVKTFRHPGNHVFAFSLTKAARLAAKHLPVLPTPRRDRTGASADVTALPLFHP